MPYRGRFAPSPTGPLHFGSLVAALGSYCDARAAGGAWLVRIEDVDLPRARPGVASLILRTLDAYGFRWDDAVMRQSSRTARYREVLDRLQAQDDVYACTCSRRVLATAPIGAGGDRIYAGTCRARRSSNEKATSTHAWRLRADSGPTHIAYVDRLQGPQSQCLPRDVGDFIVRRADGLFAYQLAVVVDDADQGITDVVRGADLLFSTPRQIHLQQRLGLPTPRYLHLPIAIDARGAKLSKQTGAAALPADPLPSLLAAWRFLDQPLPDESAQPCSVTEFWQWSLQSWHPHLLPPVAMLPAPAGH